MLLGSRGSFPASGEESVLGEDVGQSFPGAVAALEQGGCRNRDGPIR